MLLAWVVAPLLIVTISAGLGWLVEQASGRRLGVVAVPVGFAAGLCLMPILLQLGTSADLATVLIAIAGLAGWGLRVARPLAGQIGLGAVLADRNGTRWALGGAALTYLLLMLPLVLTGRVGVLGYFLLNDPAWHTGLIEWLHQYGHSASSEVTTSYEAVSQQVSAGYPLGTHAWPLVAIGLTGESAFALWTPVSAIAPAMLSIVVFVFARSTGASARWAAAIATIVAIGYLPMSYFAQGGSKELLFAFTFLLASWCVTQAVPRGESFVADWRMMLPAAVALAANAYVFGPGAALWLVPLVSIASAVVIARPGTATRRQALAAVSAATATLLFFLLPAIVKSIDLYDLARGTAEAAGEVGNLKGPVPVWEVFNAWLSYDYRNPAWSSAAAPLNVLIALVAAVLAAIGLWRALRSRQLFLPAAAASGVVAAVWVALNYNDYFFAKTLVTLAPVAGCATAAALLWMVGRQGGVRFAGQAAAVLLVLTFFAAAGMTYLRVTTTPDARFEQLAEINERASGSGPMLVAEREEYAIVLLRDAGGWNSFALARPGAPLRIAGEPTPIYGPDTDGYLTSHYDQVNTVVTRNGPDGSRPPAAFEESFSTPYYTVWKRTGESPSRHISIGLRSPGGTAELDCEKNTELREALAHADINDLPVTISQRTGESVRYLTGGPSADSDGFEELGVEQLIPGDELERGQRYTLYAQGTIGEGIEFDFGGRITQDQSDDSVRTLERDRAGRENWHPVGSFTATGMDITMTPQGGLWWVKPGGWQSTILREVALVPEVDQWKLTQTDAAGATKFCGEQVDWLEVG